MTRWRAEYDDGIWRFYRDGVELRFSVLGDIVVDALNDAESRIAELEMEVTKCHELQDAYCDRIAELEAERRWIPVSERLPELNQDVFGLVDGVIVAGSFYQDLVYGVYFSDGGSGMLVATHWMPLPELPEVER